MAAAGETAEHGTPLPLYAVGLLLAGAAWRFGGVATGASPGKRLSREPLTQGSRSAVKARLFDPLRESFGDELCARRDDGVMGFKEAITYFGALNHATECRVEAETVALRAYVTSGCPASARRARRAMRARYDLTPSRVRTCGPHTSGAKVSRSTRRRWAAISGLWLG